MNTNINNTNSAIETLRDEAGNEMQTYERANKLTIKALDNGHLQADFYRTHKHIITVCDNETGFIPSDDAQTKTAIREEFRKFMADHAADVGVNFDPADRRAEQNIRKATYKTENDVREDAIAMVTPDIEIFVGKMPHADMVKGWDISVDTMIPKTKTSKGSDLAMMGIEDGKYMSNGNLAWFDIEGVVTLQVGDQEIYQGIKMELVSGQLKKFRMTQTQWNTEVVKSMIEAGLVTEEVKAEKSAETAKVGLGDAEHEGLHMDMTSEEEAKAMAEAEEYLKTSKGKGKHGKSKSKAE